MSESESNATTAYAATDATTKSGMPQGDVDFLITCLKHTSGGSIAVDTKAVADALGYANHRSVANRVANMKKKYDLPFGSKSGDSPKKSGKASDAAGANQPAVPNTPSTNRVIKKRAPRTKKEPAEKKTPAARKPRAKKAVKVESEEEPDEQNEEVEVLELVSDDERIFGRADTEEMEGVMEENVKRETEDYGA